MQARPVTPRRPKTGWATTALFACTALALAAGCGSRLDADEIAAAGANSGGSGSSSTTGDGSTGSTTGTDGSSADTGTGTGSVDAAGASSSTSGGLAGTSTSGGTTGGGATTGGTSGGGTTAGGTTGGGTTAGGTTGGGTTAGGTTGGAPAAPGVPAILGGSTPCVPATKSPVTVGNVSTLSGVLGELFSPIRPALNLFVKSQNACGGLNGHVIKLIISDDQGDPSAAVTAVNRLIKKDKVLAFLGHVQPLTVDAITPVINAAKIPVVGSDITSNAWFDNPYLFPQGAPAQAVSYAYHDISKRLVGKTKIADTYCLEVPVACKGIDVAFGELNGKLGTQVVMQKQVSITAPSYTSQCLEAQQKGAQVVTLTYDAATMGRLANSCAKLNPPFKPQFIAYPLGVGNEQQFFSAGPALGGTYVPLTTFGWMQNDTPATKYYQDSVKRFGFSGASGNAASIGWTAGALLVAATSKLPDDPTTEDILNGLYSIKNNDLGGLSAPKLSFSKVSKGGPAGAVKYCYYVVRSNGGNTAWEKPSSTPTCTNLRVPSDANK
jgi:branched-chain amino acid transport system substrate-binding protein